MPHRNLVAILLALSLYAQSCYADNRTWTDASGSFQVEAELIELLEDAVRLRKANGKEITVDRARLSQEDQAYLAGLSAKASATPPAAVPIPSEQPNSPARAPFPADALDRLENWCTALQDCFTQGRHWETPANWLDWPLNGLLVVSWLGIAGVTAITAMFLGRSAVGWLLGGLVFPGVGLLQLLSLGDAYLPPHRRTSPILFLRLLLIAGSVGGVGYFARTVLASDAPDLERKVQQAAASHREFLWLLLADWGVLSYLMVVLAAILHRPKLGVFLASLLPFVGPLLYSLGCRSKRAQTNWVLVFPVTRSGGRTALRMLIADGQLSADCRVYWGSRFGVLTGKNIDAARIMTAVVAAASTWLPKHYDLTQLQPKLAIATNGAIVLAVAPIGGAPSAPIQAVKARQTVGVQQRGRSDKPANSPPTSTLSDFVFVTDRDDPRGWQILQAVPQPRWLTDFPDFDVAYLRIAYPSGNANMHATASESTLNQGLSAARRKSRLLGRLAAFSAWHGRSQDALRYAVSCLLAAANLEIDTPGDHTGAINLVIAVMRLAGQPKTAEAFQRMFSRFDESKEMTQRYDAVARELARPAHRALILKANELLTNKFLRSVSVPPTTGDIGSDGVPSIAQPSGSASVVDREAIRFPAVRLRCDMCAYEMQPEDVYAVSARYDVPVTPSDVARIYCSKCAGERFFAALKNSQVLIEKSHEMALAHLRQTGRLN